MRWGGCSYLPLLFLIGVMKDNNLDLLERRFGILGRYIFSGKFLPITSSLRTTGLLWGRELLEILLDIELENLKINIDPDSLYKIKLQGFILNQNYWGGINDEFFNNGFFLDIEKFFVESTIKLDFKISDIIPIVDEKNSLDNFQYSKDLLEYYGDQLSSLTFIKLINGPENNHMEIKSFKEEVLSILTKNK